MEYATLMLLAMAIIPLTVAATVAVMVVMQTPAKPRRVLSTREHRELFEAAFIAPKRIKPFPKDTHHEQETKQHSEKMASDRASGK